MKNSFPLVTAIFIMACIFRRICESVALDAVIVMAFINALSLMFVIYFLNRNIYKYISEEVDTILIDSSRKSSIVKNVKTMMNVLTLVILSAFGIVYMLRYSILANDILSIITLGISIITTEISEEIGSIIVERIKNKLCK